ncbi:MAG: metal-dependent hydrolase [Candidatus Heimdallarchaeota archaeon]|nr:metal-dependent hydrolase [Candidatus Heimdallarchaeota archaeon]MBY8994449.1 metal-dependent hydrolase [Candidatus Heimdallarchaeota archaeon]
MKINWIGHAAVKIEDKGKTILIDPWITGNPVAKIKVEDIKKADVVFVTHMHGDHGFDDAVLICKNTGATFVGIFEVANEAIGKGVENVIGGNIGGTAQAADIEFVFTTATHSTPVGVAIGFVIKLPSMTIFHPGDTGLFMNMKLLGELHDIDLAFLPIGSLYTMGPREAAKALELLNCQKVVPIHYKTFPVLVQDAEEFKKIAGPMVDVIALEPGEEKEI